MLWPRAWSNPLLRRRIAVCALHALLVLLAVDAAATAKSDGDAQRNLAVDLFAERGGVAPVTWDNDAMQVTSVISVTAKDTPIPAFGTDMDQPTLPPDNTNGSITIFTNTSADVTLEPETLEPLLPTLPGIIPSGVDEVQEPIAPSATPSIPGPSEPTTSYPSSMGILEPVTPCPSTGNPTDSPSPTVVPSPSNGLPISSEPAPVVPEPTIETLEPSSPEPANEAPQVVESQQPATKSLEPANGSPAPVTPEPTLAPGYDVNPRLFATKTAYWDQRDLFIANPDVQALKAKTKQKLQELTLLQVQQVNRAGTWFPVKSNVEDITILLAKLQTEFASLLPAWLQSYKLPYNTSIEGTLAQPGFVEMEMFGARTRETVGAALPAEFTEDSFILQHTFKSRTKDSAAAFAKSFFSNQDMVQYTEHSKMKDRFLRYFDECPRYDSEVKNNASAFAELNSFRESAAMVQNLELLKTRLNLLPTTNLTRADLESVYSACAYDILLYNTYSNWCSLLTNDIVKTMDYAEDLENFYEKGPGYKISYEISAVLLKDIYAFMKNFVDGKTEVVGNFRFAHAETTLPLMTLLGYGDRTPLLASFTADEIAFRGFRASVLAPLASNIDFRLYESKRDSSKHFVQVLVNERVAPVPGCGGAVFCELSKIEELWGYYLNTYDFDADCKVN